MADQQVQMNSNNRIWRLQILALSLLLIPLLAMQFSHEVDWSPGDFILMGCMLSGTAFLMELVLRKFRNTRIRLMQCALVLVVFLLLWAELAVGIFHTGISGS